MNQEDMLTQKNQQEKDKVAAQDDVATTGTPSSTEPPHVGGVGGVGGAPIMERDDHEVFVWLSAADDRDNFARLGEQLQKCHPRLYRYGTNGHGLIAINVHGKVRLIVRGKELASVLVDCMRVRIEDVNGNIRYKLPSNAQLDTMLQAESFLKNFPAVDQVVTRPIYRSDFTLIQPGYDAAERIYFFGELPEISSSTETIGKFLDAMAFASNADRTNTLAAALTCLLRNHFPGAKPLLYVTANKSHSGKGTVVIFIRGNLEKWDLPYQTKDWTMRSELQLALERNPGIGFVDIDYVRLGSGGSHESVIASSFLESFLTNPSILIAAPGNSTPVERPNDLVISLNTNDGQLSPDLLNRALPIRLEMTGDIDDRSSSIGNPKLEFLPANAHLIEAELHGMIARWVEQGCPLDMEVSHPMLPWARVIGGILKANGITDFLANYKTVKSVDDPIKVAIGTLASHHVDEPMSASEWVSIARKEGLLKTLLDSHDRENDRSMARALGALLSRRKSETYLVEVNNQECRVRLHADDRRWEKKANPSRKYVFQTVSEDSGTTEPPPEAEDKARKRKIIVSPKRKPR